MQAHLPTEMSFLLQYSLLPFTSPLQTPVFLEGSELTSQPANASTSAKAQSDIISDF